MQKCIVAGDKVPKDKIGPLRCNEKANEDVYEELESVIENLAEINRKKSGIIIELTALSFQTEIHIKVQSKPFPCLLFFCRKQ